MGKEQLTIGEARALVRLLSGVEIIQPGTCPGYPIGEEVVIRAESAGNWFGELEAVDGDVVRLKNARRMWG